MPATAALRRLSFLPLAAALGTALAVALMAASVWLASSNARNVRAGDALDEEVRLAQATAETVLSTLKDAETGQRGYLLTGDPSYLEPYDKARARLDADFGKLEAVARSDPEPARIALLRELASAKMAELSRTVALRQTGQSDAALAMVRTNRGNQIMAAIRVDVDALETDFTTRLARAQSGNRSAREWPAVIGLATLAFASLAGVALVQRRARLYAVESLYQLKRFTRAFGLAPGMMRELSGRITFWSEGDERLYGYSSREALGRISHDLLATRFPRSLQTIEADLMREGHWQGELVHRRRDGTELTVASQWVLHREGAGHPDAIIEVSSDITALKRADALLRTIIEAAPGLIYAKSSDGRMLLANAATLELIGKPWAEVEGRTDLEFLDDAVQAAAVMAHDRGVMDAGQAVELEEVVGAEDRADRIWLSIKTPLRDKAGVVIGLVGVSVEITQRKRMEASLRQSQRLDAVGQLTAGVAHDFNNLLQAMTMSLELLGDQTGLDAEGRECIATATNAAGRGASLVHSLLSFSRDQPLQSALLDPQRLLADVVALIARTLGSRIRIQTSVAAAAWPVRADTSQLENCLINLAVNARDAMPNGGLLQMHVSNLAVAAPQADGLAAGHYVCFAVKDAGTGMPPSVVARALEPFFTTKPSGKGTGLGLAMVHGFCCQSGGSVRIDSSPGNGTTVSLLLPRAIDSDAVGAPAVTPSASCDNEAVASTRAA